MYVYCNGVAKKGFLMKSERNELIGFILLEDDAGRKNLLLKYILILETERGKGYGSQLIKEAIRYATIHNYDVINAWVEYDTRVIRFYDKHKFLTYSYTNSNIKLYSMFNK